MRFLGAALLTAAFTLTGVAGAGRLKTRAKDLEELALTMELLGFELGCFQAPMPELSRRLAATAPARGAALFSRLAALGELRPDLCFSEHWALALRELEAPERSCLLPLGNVLGRYEAADQKAAAEACRCRLESLAGQAKEKHGRSGRVYIGLAACLGAAVSVMLL